MKFFSLLLLLVIGCTPNTPTCENCTCLDGTEENVLSNTCKSNYTCTFEVLEQSRIKLEEFEGVEKGSKTVLKMTSSTEGSPLIADDEFTNILLLEIDPDMDEFSFNSSNLDKAKLYFKRVCFCIDVTFLAPESGCIQGKKQADGSWNVEANLGFVYSYGLEKVRLNAKFK